MTQCENRNNHLLEKIKERSRCIQKTRKNPGNFQSTFDRQIFVCSYLLIWKLNFEFPSGWKLVPLDTASVSSTETPSGQIPKLQAVALETGYCPQKSCCDPSPTWSQRCAGISRREESEAGRGFHSNLLILMWVNISHSHMKHNLLKDFSPLHSYLPLVPTTVWLQEGNSTILNHKKSGDSLPWSKGPLPRMTVIGCSECLWHPMTGVQKLVVSN